VAQIALEEKAHVAVGVAWFRRTCAALDSEPGGLFRAWVGHLCPDVLKGPFNDDARVEVGLQREWYDPKQWPEEERRRLVAPEAAAAARGRGEAVGGAAGGGGGGAPVMRQEQLVALRARLEVMLQLEGAAEQGG
jgi:hypothetical protein